jgi:predicted lipase
MNKNPYGPHDVNWALIRNWEELDFVKALPNETKEKLRQMPSEAETDIRWCSVTMKVVPVLDPQHSRSYWLKIYNEQYQSVREKMAGNLALAAQRETNEVTMRNLAHISELMERLVQTNRELIESVKTITKIAEEFKDIYGGPF